ncbi:methionine ABC transporter ATP-binding protein [Micromonospora echinospora]|uniref:D-methionine transport system ATP-binding protein n=1 Tax=Micromonospora echinospora TaxID=1877 RepID=A0A1C4ZDD4_MICEC|nr:ATP-binding cassette domain-containing protein [Micromonospora echinospora]OZV80441.1 methionine ABC transporter ATP-binding protein [Micromonospora echinospora]SCF30866.1 D-methionine transport system ATP-binding protein [Micromonospora echinospora]
MIRIEGLRKTFPTRGGPVTAVDGVDLTVAEGQVFGVVGRSGAGKSTLLRCVNLLERPDEGRVTVAGVELTGLPERHLRRARQDIGMIHQHFALLHSRTAAGNVSFALEVMGVPRRKRAARVEELLDLVDLTDRADAYPAQLSGGQKQRVGIARALASRPRLLLSDEATSALDPDTTGAILTLLRDLTRRLGLTILLITHEMDVVKRLCDAVAVMRDGRFVESGPVADLVNRPDSQLARDLFPLGPVPTMPDHVLVDVTLTGRAGDDVVATLARRHDLDVRIVAGAVEQLAATRAGRLRLALPEAAPGLAGALHDLRGAGLTVEAAR